MMSGNRSYSMFRRGLYTLLFGILLLAALSISILGHGYSSVFQEALRAQSEDTAYMLSNNIELLLEGVLNSASTLGTENPQITAMLFQQEKDPIVNYEGFLQMKSLKTANPCISFVAAYNQRLDLFFSTDALDSRSKEALIDLTKLNYPSYTHSNCTLLQLNQRTSANPNQKNALTFVHYAGISQSNAIGALLIGVDCGYLQSCLTTRFSDDSIVMLLVDQDGRVISHPDADMIYADFSKQPYVSAALSSDQEIGSAMLRIDDENTLATWKKSGYGWTYISLIPYSAINSQIAFWRGIIIIVALGIAFLSVLYAYFGAKHMFKPIKDLLSHSDFTPSTGKINEMEYLSAQLTDYQKYLENHMRTHELTLGHWLRGESESDEAFCLDYLKSHLREEKCALALLSIDRTKAYRQLDNDRHREIMQALGNYVKWALACPACYVVISGNMAAIIFPASSDENAGKKIRSGLNTFYAQFILPCCAAYPEETSGIEALPALCAKAESLMEEHYYAQGGGISLHTAKEQRSKGIQYDFKWELSIWEAIRRNDADELEKSVESFFSILRQCDYDFVKLYLRLLMCNVIAYFCAAMNDSNADALYAEMRSIIDLETLDLAHEAMSDMFLSLAQRFTALPESDAAARIVRMATSLTRENYTNPGFALNDVAGAMDLSPVYFNRMFKKATGKSYSAYLNSFRLTMLCSLLRSTNKPLNHLCTEVGIANESYCYTLFKKEYGITPSQYRARYAPEKEADPENSEKQD